MTIHKYIFYEICEKNIDVYFELIRTMRSEYKAGLRIITNVSDIGIVRYNIHKMLGVICYLGNKEEIIYICKMILQIDKKETNFEKYEYWIQKLKEISIDSIFGVI